MKVHRVKRLLLASAGLVVPAALSAQAFGLNEIGTCAVGRAFAATASPCKDASAIYWNSAATTQLTGWTISGGATAIKIKARFTQDTTRRVFDGDVPTQFIPHLFLNYHPANSKAAYGVGVYVPYGLTSQWTDDFPGRFLAKKASLATVYVQPNIAWQLNSKWSVGGGPVIGHSTVELIQGIDLSDQFAIPGVVKFGALGIATGTEFARARLKGSAMAYGAQIAIAGQPSTKWSVGLRFLTPLEFKYNDADATFTQINTGLVLGGTLVPPFLAGAGIDTITAIRSQFTSGALVSQKVSTKITHPAQIQGGAAYTGLKNWLIEADVAWVGWKRFDVLPVTFAGPAAANSRTLLENYNNTTSIRIGAEYTIPTDGWTLRAGFAAAASAAPSETVTPLLPEQDRAYWTFGASIPIMKTWTIDGGYGHISTPGARGRIVERTSPSQTGDQLNSGVYTLSANLFSLALRASF